MYYYRYYKRYLQAELHPEVVENAEKESKTIEVICKRNEYES